MTTLFARRTRLTPVGYSLASAMLLPLVLAACSPGDTIANTRNVGVCAAIEQGLGTLDQNIEKVKAGVPLPAGTDQAVAQLDGALQTATKTATGELAASLTGLDTSLSGLVQAATGGSSAQVAAAVAAVKTDLRAVQAQCGSA